MHRMHPAVAKALEDHRIFNESGQWWARFHCFVAENHSEPQVFLTYGVIHPNGFKEIALRTVKYYVGADGKVTCTA